MDLQLRCDFAMLRSHVGIPPRATHSAFLPSISGLEAIGSGLTWLHAVLDGLIFPPAVEMEPSLIQKNSP